MPFARPTLSALIEQAQTDVAVALGLYGLLRFSPERALATAQAGLAGGLYGYLDYVARQAVPFTAEGEYLRAWAALVGVSQKTAAAATGSATFTGANGSSLPIDTLVRAPGTGVAYRTTASGVVSGGAVTVTLEAEDTGAAGNLLAGAPLVLGAAVPGVQSAGFAFGALSGGADLEEVDDMRARMLEVYGNPPQGGAAPDYVAWALEVPGITRAWVTANGFGAGTVIVHVMLDDVRAGSGGFPAGSDGTATAEPRAGSATGDQLLVADHLFPLQPVTALVYVAAPIGDPLAFSILDVPDAGLRPAITAALDAVFRDKAAVAGTLYPSDFTAALDAVPGLTQYSMPVPSGPVTTAAGHLSTRGTITWT